mmetsp:Transcript_122475/g.329008  ORF Transcript_122475/g.329008 Transcript_122475/m.329008 type:complete len:217 (+) Transcript_122475:798-1448(+)
MGSPRRPASCGPPTPASRGAAGDCASPVAASWRRRGSPTSPPRSRRQPPSPRRRRSRRTRRRGGRCSFERGAKAIAWPTPESSCPRQRGRSRCGALGPGLSQRAAGSSSDVSARGGVDMGGALHSVALEDVWARGCPAPRRCGSRRFHTHGFVSACARALFPAGACRASQIHGASGPFFTSPSLCCASSSLPRPVRLASSNSGFAVACDARSMSSA